MSPEETTLRSSIEHLYEVFAVYPLADVVEGCPCCTTEEDHRSIHSKPLRQLTGKDLDRFAMKAMTTWGDQTDFKHFLPRLFEVLAFEWESLTMPEALVGRLMHTGWKGQQYQTWLEWPDNERLALESYFMALWSWVLANPGYPLAEEWLSTLAYASPDLTPFLSRWWSLDDSEGALSQLAYFMYWRDAGLQRGELDSPFWNGNPDGARQLLEWAQNPGTVELLKQGLPRVRHAQWLEQYGVTQDWIDWVLAS